MKLNIRLIAAGLVLFLAVSAQAALPLQVGDQAVPSLAPLVEAASPAVVNISVSQTLDSPNSPFADEAFRRWFGLPDAPRGSRQVSSAGSGVIVDAANGYILTNHHVVEGADEIQITLYNGDTLDAEIIGSDAATDIAVLRVEANGLTEMPIGDSDRVRVGDFVIAIGNPFGLGHTVTSGIVSALGRTGIGDGLEDFIQTDASINPGNSGGALVNLHGELVGINSAIISRSGGNVGIGFAVPTEIASSIMNQILDFGEVRRGLLGVTISTLGESAAEELGADIDRGALITEVVPESAADKAGLRVEDIIIEVNGRRIANNRELINVIGLRAPGETVDIRYIRQGETLVTRAELGERITVASSGSNIHPGLAGAEFASNTTTSGNGIEVTSVEPGSAPAQRGLRGGDVIIAVNRRAVRSMSELIEVASEYEILFLLVQRGDRQLMVQIR